MIHSVARLARFVARAGIASLLGKRCNSALVDFSSEQQTDRFGIVVAACDRRSGHVGNHAGADKRGKKLEW